ncbi:MAG: glycosyltransferase [Polyangiaceae bacterium]|nr:glycosyltransferase [Polyangiaceae bacterium]
MKLSTVLAVGVRSIEASLRRLAGARARPYKLLLELTAECNSRCRYCSIWKAKKRQDCERLALPFVERLFSESGKDLVWLALSGGEVTLYDEFPSVIELAKRHCPNLRLVTFTTNGLLPGRTLAWGRAIVAAGFDGFVTVSLDGDEKTHDWLRGVRGNHARAWETYRLLRGAGIPAHFGMTVSDQSEAFLKGGYSAQREHFKAFTFVHGEGIYGQTNRPDDASIRRSLLAVKQAYRIRGAGELIEKMYLQLGLRFLEQARSRNIVPCGVGHASLDVRPDGSVSLCMYLPPIGNIKERGSLREMVNAPETGRQLHRVARNECRHCWMNCYAPHSIMLSPLRAAWRCWVSAGSRKAFEVADASGRPAVVAMRQTQGRACSTGAAPSVEGPGQRATGALLRRTRGTRLSVLVPVYQEERTVAKVLRQLMALDTTSLDVELEVIVCDDGSTDASVGEVRLVQREYGNVKLVRHERNRGKGAAIRTALAHATGEFVLVQDADLEYDVQSYPRLLAAARDGADVVYGSRFLHRRYPTGMHPANYVANKVLTLAANLLFCHHITDEATCLKLVRTELIRSLGLSCERFEFCPELTAKLGLVGAPIKEVPVDYQARDSSEGKKVRWTDGLQALAVLAVHRVRPGACWRHDAVDAAPPRSSAAVVERPSADQRVRAGRAASVPATIHRPVLQDSRAVVGATNALRPTGTDGVRTFALDVIEGRPEDRRLADREGI